MNRVTLVSSSIDKSMLFILIFAINRVFLTRIGFISNVTYIPSNKNETFINMTCIECTCAAFIYSALGWNCMENNNICQLINNYTLNDIGLIKSVNSTFLFQQLPPQSLLTSINAITTETTTIKTTVTPTIRTTPTGATQTETTPIGTASTGAISTGTTPTSARSAGTTPTGAISTGTTQKGTASTVTTSTVHINTTTQNPQLGSLGDGSITENSWTMYTYSYLAATSTNRTLKFVFQTGNKHDWYLDDVSVKNSTSMEMMINGNFESTPSLVGWTFGSSGSCSSNSGISSTYYHSLNQSYHHGCGSTNTWINQSFAAIGGQVYNVTFWVYYYRTGSGVGSGTDQMIVTMN